MKRKVGDKVKIRKDLVVGENYGDAHFNQGMVDLMGKEVTITRAYIFHDCYELNAGDMWFWTEEMFEQ